MRAQALLRDTSIACADGSLAGFSASGRRRFWMLLADLFTLDLNIGSGLFTLAIDIGKSKALADFLAITVSVAGYTITYNLIDFLVILGISVIATVLVEKLA